jgi:hypothetical protein
MTNKKRDHDLIRYSFKGPGWGRMSFAIYLDVKGIDGVRSCSTTHDERLIAINRAYRSGSSSKEECKVLVKEIVKDLYKKDRRCHKKFHVHNAENWKVLEEYWEKVYSFRSLVCEVSTKNDLKRAVEALGQLSIYSASREEIQNAIDQKFKGNSQRRVIARLTQLLKFIGRENLKLRKQLAGFTQISYLNEDDFKKVLHFVPTEIEKSLLKLCYYSGLRIGEAYALEPHSLLPNGTIRVMEGDKRSFRSQAYSYIRYIFEGAGIPATGIYPHFDKDSFNEGLGYLSLVYGAKDDDEIANLPPSYSYADDPKKKDKIEQTYCEKIRELSLAALSAKPTPDGAKTSYAPAEPSNRFEQLAGAVFDRFLRHQ